MAILYYINVISTRSFFSLGWSQLAIMFVSREKKTTKTCDNIDPEISIMFQRIGNQYFLGSKFDDLKSLIPFQYKHSQIKSISMTK